ncbi:hypothetical protein [Paracoccus homiensis]|uniref:Uncharacterized protein n=1 Tax=Paracoccus homiensis TaxID=364199 RepID=A0A1I0JI11_9RHOB|nr:hypothetical protein [Paracoccus homiensis]SEU09132.1 hypothetical protein SAMN04489858_12614 [Paracoccus homiensis]
MTQNGKPLSIAEIKRNAIADAALEQMYAYFSRDDHAPRVIVTEYPLPLAA